ncbi:MAG: hypothetical protein D6677_09585 [Calditrichaeota bacterium]|nr:MAG: hypothetical protein D6677_09585 [Calditrichota bacterium]
MDDFNTFIQDWKSTPQAPQNNGKNTDDSLMAKVRSFHKKTVFENLKVSVAFALTFIVMGVIYTVFKEQGWLFYTSILALMVLMTLTLVMFWYRTLFWRRLDFNRDVLGFSNKVIKKLKTTLWLEGIYMPLYLLLLAVILTFYLADVLKSEEPLFLYGAWALSYAWLWGMGMYGRRRFIKKRRPELEKIIREMENIRNTLE